MTAASLNRLNRLHARYHTAQACRVCVVVWRHLERRQPWMSPRDTDYAV